MTQLLESFKDISVAFTSDLGVWWFLAPIFVLWFSIEIYLGQYQKEKWGFSSALANSVSFTWINITSLRIISLEEGIVDERLLVAILFLAYGIFLIYASFKHFISPRVMDILSGPNTVYFLSIVSVLWGQGLLKISWPIVIDLIVIYLIIVGIWALIKKKYLGIPGEIEAIKRGERPI
jgi:hypothetical protein